MKTRNISGQLGINGCTMVAEFWGYTNRNMSYSDFHFISCNRKLRTRHTPILQKMTKWSCPNITTTHFSPVRSTDPKLHENVARSGRGKGLALPMISQRLSSASEKESRTSEWYRMVHMVPLRALLYGLVAGLEHEFYFPIYWEVHHPN